MFRSVYFVAGGYNNKVHLVEWKVQPVRIYTDDTGLLRAEFDIELEWERAKDHYLSRGSEWIRDTDVVYALVPVNGEKILEAEQADITSQRDEEIYRLTRKNHPVFASVKED